MLVALVAHFPHFAPFSLVARWQFHRNVPVGRPDWQKLSSQATRWKVEKAISPVAAMLNHRWQAGIPASERSAAFDLGELIQNEEELQRTVIRRVPAGFLNRLLKARELPDLGARLRFLFHIFFPTRENLHWRYGSSADKTILSHYLLHLSYITKRFFSGVALLFYGILKGYHRPQRS